MANFSQPHDEWTFPFCPQPPQWRLDWEGIEAAFDWARSMKGCPQDPRHHAEGDVFIHTRLVCEALTQSPRWRALTPLDRSIMFAATLMHDIAKPLCTQVDEEAVRAPGHARRGALMARHELWRHASRYAEPAFQVREAIVGLVRRHGAPLYFVDAAEPQREIVLASQAARCDWLAILAAADVQGRECPGKNDLFERVHLFEEQASEVGCLTRPYAFPNDHSRFLYFQSPGSDLHRVAYDDTRSTVTIMSGMPGAGKDHWLRENRQGAAVISLDEFRRKLNIDPTDKQGAVVQAAKDAAKSRLRREENFAWNATNITRSMRGQLVRLFRRYHARVEIVFIEASWAELLSRNARRDAGVPEAALEKLGRRIDVPDVTEGQQVVAIRPAAGNKQ